MSTSVTLKSPSCHVFEGNIKNSFKLFPHCHPAKYPHNSKLLQKSFWLLEYKCCHATECVMGRLFPSNPCKGIVVSFKPLQRDSCFLQTLAKGQLFPSNPCKGTVVSFKPLQRDSCFLQTLAKGQLFPSNPCKGTVVSFKPLQRDSCFLQTLAKGQLFPSNPCKGTVVSFKPLQRDGCFLQTLAKGRLFPSNPCKGTVVSFKPLQRDSCFLQTLARRQKVTETSFLTPHGNAPSNLNELENAEMVYFIAKQRTYLGFNVYNMGLRKPWTRKTLPYIVMGMDREHNRNSFPIDKIGARNYWRFRNIYL